MNSNELLKEFWPLVVGFLGAGGTWYWTNKRNKQDTIKAETEQDSIEIENMKSLMVMFQDSFKKELIEKNDTIEKLSNQILELNSKVDKLTSLVREMQNNFDDEESKIIRLANKCKNRPTDETCEVLDYIKTKKQN